MGQANQARRRKIKASQSRHSQFGASQRIRPHLCFELLENRLNLTILVGTASDDTLLVNATGPDSGTYILNGGAAVSFSGETIFQFDGLGGNDLLQINNPAGGLLAPTSGIFFNGGGQLGDSLENLGGVATSGSYSVGPANGDGVLSHTDGVLTQTITFTGLAPATDTVAEATFTITADAAANEITLDDGTATGDGLLRVAIDAFEPIEFANKTNVIVNAGGGPGTDLADTINADYTELSTGLSTVTFNADDGGDFIVVHATPAGVTTTANGDSGDDVFLIDSNGFAGGGTLNGILGPVNINGGDNTNLSTVSITTGGGVTTTLVMGDRVLFVDADNPSVQSSAYSLTDTLFQRISNSPGGTATAPVSFATVERIDVLTGAGTDNILVSTTRDETTLIVSPGGGNDTVTVQNTGSGPAGAANIVFVDGGAGADTIDVQATGANAAVLASGGSEDDLITFGNVGAASRVTLNGGNGADTLNVLGTGINSGTEVIGGGGNDTINLGSAGNSLDTIQGEVRVDGQGDAGAPGDVLTLNDAGTLTGNTYTIDATTVTRAGVGPIIFAGLERLALNAGQGSDTINVTPSVATTIDIDGNPPTPPTLPGDTLDVDTTVTANPSLTSTSAPDGLQGAYTFADRQPVNFQEIETLTTEATITTLVGAPNPSVFGEMVTFTATVAPASGTGSAPTGQVTFVDITTGTTLGTVTLAGGAATLSTNSLGAGLHVIRADYQSDGIYAASSGTFTQTVNQATTTTNVTSSNSPSVFGQPVTFTATVSANAPSTATPTGTVTFIIDGNTVGTVSLNASGQASFTTSALGAGPRSIVATFNANANFNSSTDALTQTVSAAATTTALTSSSNPSSFGQPITFTATVTAAAPSTATPTGTVTFIIDGNTVGTVSLNASGQASFTTSALAAGPHVISAQYTSGTPNLLNSVSPPLAQQVNFATVTGGKLLIDGTSDNDIVTITGVGAGTGVYVVTRQQGAGLVQTQTVTGVTGDICVFLHAGNDQLTMNNVFINGSIIVEMDTGNDTVTLGHANVVSTREHLNVDLGAGNDTLNGRRIFIGGNQNLTGGDGNDTMTFDGFTSPFTLGASAAGNANWLTGSGNDAVNVVYAFIGGAWAIDLAAGTDSLNIFGSSSAGNMSTAAGAGDDTMNINTNFFDSALFLDGGAENDTVFVANSLGAEFAAINTGAGADTITVRNQSASLMVIDSGTGNDTVEARSSAFDRFFAILGDDDDQLLLFGNLFRFEMDLDGGNGNVDRLVNLGNDTRGAARARNFELLG